MLNKNTLIKGITAAAVVITLGYSYTQVTEKQKIQKSVITKLGPFAQLANLNFARAGSAATPHITNILRQSFGLIMGYNDNVSYGELACNGTTPAAGADCSGPPHDGIVGRLTSIINTLPTIGKSGGINSCTDVPATGSITGSDGTNNVVINFKTPTHTIPGSWLGGGTTFQKRVEFQETILDDVTKFAYEFNCGDSPAAYIAINMDMGNIQYDSNAAHTYPYKRLITLYTGQKSATLNGIEVYMSEATTSVGGRVRGLDAVRIEYNKSSSEFELWGVLQSQAQNSNQVVGRTAMHGNYSDGKATVFYNAWELPQQSGNDSAINASAVLAANSSALATATGLTNGGGGLSTSTATFDENVTSNTASTTPGEINKKGCVNFNTPNTAPTATTDCAGYSLNAVSSAPFIDSAGAFSLSWALSTMTSKLEVLQ